MEEKLILIASDIHADEQAFEKLAKIAETERCISFLFAGDLGLENPQIRNLLDQRSFVFLPVKGNCDWVFPPPPLFRVYETSGLKILMTHGDRYITPPSGDFDIIITGHTHKVNLSRPDKTVLLNPGSASRPRGPEGCTYATIEINQSSFLVSIRSLDNDRVISKLEVLLKK